MRLQGESGGEVYHYVQLLHNNTQDDWLYVQTVTASADALAGASARLRPTPEEAEKAYEARLARKANRRGPGVCIPSLPTHRSCTTGGVFEFVPLSRQESALCRQQTPCTQTSPFDIVPLRAHHALFPDLPASIDLAKPRMHMDTRS